ncbi:hypothetical protein LuPra_04544 [Luteitalea pratensis]|uniref:Uncharacterized protein n=1 Tax=Luteitalea pratensis TaxID=1855912 RepID=A0A143PSJ7_LUTPR|nr:hypothetical protein [Luteitalea pratensis]AMY11296.1 hypothetical protein LuPra_04544 [Luteitalea pratensis]
MPTTDTPNPLEPEMDALALDIVRLIADSACDPLAKPFAALQAAADVCQMAAAGSDHMRLRCASAAIRIAQMLAPERTTIVEVQAGVSH